MFERDKGLIAGGTMSSPALLRIDIETQSTYILVRVEGPAIDSSNIGGVWQALCQVSGDRTLLLDLRKVGRFGPALLAAVLKQARRSKTGGRHFGVIIRPSAQELFDISGFSKIVRTTFGRKAAVAAIGEPLEHEPTPRHAQSRREPPSARLSSVRASPWALDPNLPSRIEALVRVKLMI